MLSERQAEVVPRSVGGEVVCRDTAFSSYREVDESAKVIGDLRKSQLVLPTKGDGRKAAISLESGPSYCIPLEVQGNPLVSLYYLVLSSLWSLEAAYSCFDFPADVLAAFPNQSPDQVHDHILLGISGGVHGQLMSPVPSSAMCLRAAGVNFPLVVVYTSPSLHPNSTADCFTRRYLLTLLSKANGGGRVAGHPRCMCLLGLGSSICRRRGDMYSSET